MVEQRSPKPLVACSNRVSPATKYLTEGWIFFYIVVLRYTYIYIIRATNVGGPFYFIVLSID